MEDFQHRHHYQTDLGASLDPDTFSFTFSLLYAKKKKSNLLSSPVSIYHVQPALLLCNPSLFPFIYTCCVIPAAPASAFGQIVISNKE